ncbi:hypothetical protein M622_01890 [Thauera terpenica 58Eu]|uniref:FAD assembly factor SdhE n=2 Tax=Thauera terpenica TaxID=76113 RepID=S9ZQY2_9RHOO|nr:hypothetical protein M622_01890 [Thauera terpenica 58Eu]
MNRGRIRWQCRRALLELDLVFTRFLERDFDRLTDDQLADLDDLLRCDDYDIWALVNGSKACEVDRWQEMIGLLRQS